MEGILRRRAQESLAGSIDWITGELSFFAPRDEKIPSQMKAATELAMFYGHTASWWDSQIRRQLLPIRRFLLDLYGSPALAHWMRRFPCHYNHYATGYLALRAAGERIPAFEEALALARRSGYPQAIEKTPYRELGSQFSLWQAGLRARPPSFGALFRLTSLARCSNPIYLSTSEVYSITHTLFYAADIAGPCSHIPASIRRRAVDLVETLLVHYTRKPDWDIAGELLLNLVALDACTTPLFESAFGAMLAARLDDGTVPGPRFSIGRPQPSRKRIFDHCYHTTLVAMFLWGAYLHRTRSVPGTYES